MAAAAALREEAAMVDGSLRARSFPPYIGGIHLIQGLQMAPLDPSNRPNAFRKVRVQTGSESVQNHESSGNSRRPEGLVCRRYGRLRSYRRSSNLLLLWVFWTPFPHMNSVLSVLRLVGIVRTSPTLQQCLFFIWSSLKNDHFPSHFACIWCLVTSSDSFPFVSFDHGLFINPPTHTQTQRQGKQVKY